MKTRTILFAALVAILAGLDLYQFFAFTLPSFEPNPPGRFLDKKWLGIQTLQHPFDVWTTQEIIWEVKPDFIVETGTFRGGSAALWATILEQANPEGRVITIDIEDRAYFSHRLPIVKKRVDFLVGSSVDPKLVARVARRVQGKKVMVILDSLHTREHVLAELEAYSPLVTVGSYLIVQDTHLGETYPFFWLDEEHQWIPGPLRAVEEFLAADDDFEIDSTREAFASTNNHNGFLKRVK